MIIDFSNGINTFEYIMLQEFQSEEYADEIIKIFKERWIGCGDPSQFLSDIADEILPDAESLLPASIKRIENEINNYLEVFHV